MPTDPLPPQAETAFQSLARMISEARIRAETKAKATHERFNVFTTLLKAKDEVRLHTRFLHCLLDPNGVHDCGPLFLKLFFETLAEHPGMDHEGEPVSMRLPPADNLWTVEKEASRSPHGQIDILLERYEYGIAIENKIYAYEQARQLACYGTYLQEKFQGNAHLIYLTRDGKCGSTHENVPYIRISYAEHILAWLEKCLRETYAIIPINQALLQYREVVRQLTGRTLNAEKMKPIIEFIRQNPDIIKFRNDIIAATEEAVQKTWEEIESGIRACLPEMWTVKIKGKVYEPNYEMTITPPKGHILCTAPFGIFIEKDEENLSFGISPEKRWNQLDDFNKRLYLNMRKGLPCDGINDLWRWPVGWINLIPGVSDEKFADVVKNPDIPGICSRIRDYICKLEAAYSKAKQDDSMPHSTAPSEVQ